jgi:hypothetical protein
MILLKGYSVRWITYNFFVNHVMIRNPIKKLRSLNKGKEMTQEAMNKFEDIQHTPLRIFNRVMYLTNLISDKGMDQVKAYSSSFTEKERIEMTLVAMSITVRGLEAIRKEVTKGMEFTYDPSEDIEYGV